jgi:serine/threonine-protein kinase RsbW
MRSEQETRDEAFPARSATPPVLLTIPADNDYVALVRSVVGQLGARTDLTLEELGDLRLAVDEACALLLRSDEIDTTGAVLECRFTEVDGALHVSVAAEAADGAGPQVGGFGWNLLSALVDDLQWSSDHGRAEVRIVKQPAVRIR